MLFGGKEAIVVSTFETLATCYILKKQGVKFSASTIPYNVASVVLTTTTSFFTITSVSKYSGRIFELNNTNDLFIFLGIIALTQFIVNSILVSVFVSLRSNINLWNAWKQGGFSISITQIVGASIAGVFYKLFNNGDYFATGIGVTVLVVAYLTYRKIIGDMTSSIDEAEKAQLEKAEVEKSRAEQAENHAEELAKALAEQEIISEKLQESNLALEHAAYYDDLTKLPNRAYLIERLSLLLELGIDISNKYFVLFLDLKRFKNINNRLGHSIGDKVLILVAKRLLRAVKMEDTVARLGGDEFAIILNDLRSVEDAKSYAQKIHQKLIQPFSSMVIRFLPMFRSDFLLLTKNIKNPKTFCAMLI